MILLSVSVNEIMDPEFRTNLRSGVASLSNTAKSIDEAELKATLENINKFTQMLAENSDKMTSTFSNLENYCRYPCSSRYL